MQVEQLWRYPVKSMLGEVVDSVDLVAAGVAGDRGWAVRDEERGGIRGAKKIGGLMKLGASYYAEPGGPVTIALPDGMATGSSDSDVNEKLSAALGHEVSLWPLMPADDLDHYRRGAPDSEDMLEELRGIFGRTEDEPLPDLSVFPPEIIEFESPPGSYVDAFPLMLMTTSALRSLSEALPDSVIDVRRFRPSILIDSGDEQGHPELGWEGRRLRIGNAELELTAACPRCVMVTREVTDDIPQDRAVLRHIVAELDQCVGIYANVTVPSSVARGDEVELLD
ncbi:MAG: MOSC domain-containing protein [Actinomycetia bacterium]|nr:MOSC domain-containing protein [Actinomycetes bacterium]